MGRPSHFLWLVSISLLALFLTSSAFPQNAPLVPPDGEPPESTSFNNPALWTLDNASEAQRKRLSQSYKQAVDMLGKARDSANVLKSVTQSPDPSVKKPQDMSQQDFNKIADVWSILFSVNLNQKYKDWSNPDRLNYDRIVSK